MRDYGVSTEEAMVKFQEMAEIAWKDVNEGILRPAPVSTGILTRILNLARIINVPYKHNQNGYTHPDKMDASQKASYHAGEAKGQTQEKASQIMDKARDTVQSAQESMQETGQQMKAKAQGAVEAVKDIVGANK
ncbi:hypothetical protein RND71_014551 [Anisodus tanguticus]|uniref:Uncharacterized protein n=1 Tax=Anisodus tanguticus TaxID=243964 RepID=A0AAE1VK04_9SOLA|nr:hypothetical protein RND71_014551 [Anisodus tanguticus]